MEYRQEPAAIPGRTSKRQRRGSSQAGVAAAVVVALAATPVLAQAEESADDRDGEVLTFGEEIVVVGTRGEGRSVAESMVPVDVLTGDDLLSQGDTDVANLVRPPSYNVRSTDPTDRSIQRGDAAKLTTPARR